MQHAAMVLRDIDADLVGVVGADSRPKLKMAQPSSARLIFAPRSGVSPSAAGLTPDNRTWRLTLRNGGAARAGSLGRQVLGDRASTA